MTKTRFFRCLAALTFPLAVFAIPTAAAIGPAVDAEKEDALVGDNGDGVANPGETVKYTVRVTASGGDVTNLNLQDVLDGRTALSGMVKSKPLALPDAYSTLGNIEIVIPAGSGLLVNDVDAENIIKVGGVFQDNSPLRAANFGLTAMAEGPKATTGGGTVTITADGGFTYNPPRGFTGTDTFSYELKDADMNTDTGTVSVSIGTQAVWFVDAAAAAGGDGTQGAPYKTLAEYNAGDTGGLLDPGDGDVIFIASSGSAYDGGIRLRANQTLVGQGVSLAGIVTPPTGATFPGAITAPTIANSAGALSGHGVELAMSNTITGLSIGNTPNGYGVSGNNFGTLTVDNTVSITGAGGGLDLSNGTSAATFSSITANSALTRNGVRATGVSGTLNLGVCNITTTTGKGLDLGGGTFNSSSGTISTGTGVAVDVDNAALGLNLTSVSSNGASIGIDLLNTTGKFTVTGDGSSGVQGGNGSGGTLQSTTSDAIRLNNTGVVSLKHMTIGDPAASASNPPDGTNNINGDGIDANTVAGLTIDQCKIARTGDHGINATSLSNLNATSCLILNAGDAQEEHGFRLRQLAGDNFVRDSLFDAFNETGIELINTSGSVDLTVDNTTFQDNQTTVGNAGEEAILLIAQGTAEITALITGDSDTNTTDSIFDDLDLEAIQAISEGGTSDIQLTVENSRFLEGDAGDGVIIFNPEGNGSGNITVRNNFFTDDEAFGPFAVLLKNDSTGTLEATVADNTVMKHALLSLNHDDIGSSGPANGTTAVNVDNNVVTDASGIPIDVIATEDPATGGDPDFRLILTDNNVGDPPPAQFAFSPGIRITISDRTRARMKIQGNTAQGEDVFGSGPAEAGIRIDQLDTATVGIEGLTGSAATYLNGINTSDLPVAANGTYSATSGPVAAPAATTLPSP